jgi:TM2 domain-containing membrane protein YozV
MKSKSITAILALLLGTLGIHRFYLGQFGYGIIYLLLGWTGISSVLAIIDFVIFLLMSEEEFDITYNTWG